MAINPNELSRQKAMSKICPTCGQVLGGGQKPIPKLPIPPGKLPTPDKTQPWIPGYHEPGTPWEPKPPDRKLPTPGEDRRMKPPGFPDKRFPEPPIRKLPQPNSYQGMTWEEYGQGGWEGMTPEQRRAWEEGAGYNPSRSISPPFKPKSGLAKKTYPLPYPKNYRR